MITDQHVKKIIENNLEYAELLLVPNDTDLLLIDKDAGLGNITAKQQGILLSCFNSLHSIQRFTKQIEIYVKNTQNENEQDIQIPINIRNYSTEQIKQGLKSGEISKVFMQVPRYPATYQDLRSRISSLLITSGSVEGFRSILQHSSIVKQTQDQTLQEISPVKKNKRGKKQ